jgi:hypothetical protein
MPKKASAICFILLILIILGREDQTGIRTYIYMATARKSYVP